MNRRRLYAWAAALATVWAMAAAPARAQKPSVRWEMPDGAPYAGGRAKLALIFENCQPESDPEPPQADGLSVTSVHSSQNMSWINGVMSFRREVVFGIRAGRAGTFTIPAREIQTDKGRVTVPDFTFEAGQAPVGGQPAAVGGGAFESFLRTKSPTLWAGEVFEVEYAILGPRSTRFNVVDNFDWPAADLLLERWSDADQVQTEGGTPRVGLRMRARAVAPKAGALELPPASQDVRVQTGSRNWGFFSQPEYDQVTVASNPLKLEVKPLPEPAPAGFTGAVGAFELKSKVVPREVSVGEPVTWSLDVAGTGNWPAGWSLPPREVSADWKAIQPKSKRSNPEGKLFEGALSEDVILVPTQPGEYTLGPVEFAYFDPAKGEYATARTEAVQVRVKAAPGAAAVPAPAPPGHSPGGEPAAKAPAQPAESDPPLPGDPLEGAGNARAPLGGWFPALAAAPWAVLLAAWLAAAWRAAVLHDPVRKRRLARLEAIRAAEALDAGGLEPTAARMALVQWRAAAAALWDAPGLEPSATALARAAAAHNHGTNAALWQSLRAEADAALFGPDPSLPGDWPRRARAAAEEARLPGVPFWRALQPRHLLPAQPPGLAAAALFAFAAVVAPLAVAALGTVEEALAAYRAGDFSKAERLWSERAAAAPADWKARANAALAMAQQDRWAAAACEWAAALARAPRSREVRWNGLAAVERAGLGGAPVDELFRGAGSCAPLRVASAFEWQMILFVGSVACAAGLGLRIWRRHGGPRRARVPGVVLSIVGGAGMAAAAAALLAMREWGDAHAAVVVEAGELRSIPSDVEQKTRPLGPGTVGIVERAFLDRWLRLRLPSGETGWVTRGQAVQVYPEHAVRDM